MIRAAAAGFLLLLAGRAVAGDALVLDTDGASRRFALQNGRPSGFFADLLTQAFAAGGTDVDFHVRPWARCFEEARVGIADGLFAIYRFPEREGQFLYSEESLYIVHEHIFVRHGEGFDAARWREALRGKKIGIVNGSYHGHLYRQAVAENLFGSVEMANSVASLANMLGAGRIDAAFSTDELMGGLAGRAPPAPAVDMTEPEIEAMPVYLAFTRKRDMSELRDGFDRELRNMKADGRYDALLEKYEH